VVDLGCRPARLRDRLRELRLAPWADAGGDGVTLRMAAARAALGRLREWTPEWRRRPPADLIVATGGAWAVARTGRRVAWSTSAPPGAGQTRWINARILGHSGRSRRGRTAGD